MKGLACSPTRYCKLRAAPMKFRWTLNFASPPRIKPAGLGGISTQKECLKESPNLRHRDAKPVSCFFCGKVLTCATAAAGPSGGVLRFSSATIRSTFARISSVRSTQSIGIELHPSVGQLTCSRPMARRPTDTWIWQPVTMFPQTRQ